MKVGDLVRYIDMDDKPVFGLIVEESVFNEDRGAETVDVVWFDDGDVTAEATIDLCDPEHEYLEIISEGR